MSWWLCGPWDYSPLEGGCDGVFGDTGDTTRRCDGSFGNRRDAVGTGDSDFV